MQLASSDPFVLHDTFGNFASTNAYRQPLGRKPRSFDINPAIKTLALIVPGQSAFGCNVTPTLYVPANSAAIDNLNIYDGGLYDCNGPLLGCTYNPALVPPLGPGNVSSRLADRLVTNGRFDRVMIASIAVGSSAMEQWADIFADRVPVTMRRLAARNITPATTGVTFACYLQIGAQDFGLGTTKAAFIESANRFISTLFNTGFNGRLFISQQSGIGHTGQNPIRDAQAALWNGSSIQPGGDMDSPTISTSDGNHPDDAGAAAGAVIADNAMHASGAPY